MLTMWGLLPSATCFIVSISVRKSLLSLPVAVSGEGGREREEESMKGEEEGGRGEYGKEGGEWV